MAGSRCSCALVAALLLLLLSACGPKTYHVHGTQLAVGTDGKISIEEIEGGNHLVTVELEHLTPPERLDGGLTTYCMWIAEEGQPHRLASIVEFDEGDRVAKARATTPAHRFEVRITAERGRNPTSPSEHTVLRQRVSH